MGIFADKFKEVLRSTMPVVVVLAILAIFVLHTELDEFLMFLICVAMVLIGFTIFLAGIDLGVDPMGRAMGNEISKRKSRIFMIVLVFVISFLVTLAEPDVTVFASQVNDLFEKMDPLILAYAIAIGVAVFLIIASFKIIYKLSLRVLMTVSYIAVIILAFLLESNGLSEFLGISFDSGGVTTGPLTVPILLALGIGICMIGGSKANEMDGFGMVGLASVGPIIAVMILGLVMGDSDTNAFSLFGSRAEVEISFEYIKNEFLLCAEDVATAIIPLIIFFVIFKKFWLKYSWSSIIDTIEGTLIAGAGVIIFLTGVYSGFMPIATKLGEHLSSGVDNIWIIGLGFLLGFLVAFAEPAVGILGNQVERSSNGALPKTLIIFVISIGVAALVGLGMAKLLFNINLLWIVIPGYVLTLILMWIGDKDMVGIAFDAGGVSTGPMSVAILSSIYVGLAGAIYAGREATTNGFGLIALIALAPCLFLSILGVYTKYHKRRETNAE